MIYFDNAATTQVLPEAADAAYEMMCESYGNPSSMHGLGLAAELAVKDSRKTIAAALGCSAEELTFTSCGTEANNLAIFGAAARCGKRRHMIVSAVEHPSVLNAAKALEARDFDVTYIRPRNDGVIHTEDIVSAMTDNTFLVSVMAVNNEVGALMPVSDIARAVHAASKKTLFHTDAVQAFLNIPVNAQHCDADFLTISGHKVHAPKGIGALYIRRGIGISPRLVGGGQERGLRSGTEAVPQIAAFGKAVALGADFAAAAENCSRLIARMRNGLSSLSGAHILTPSSAAPHILCVAFTKYPSEVCMRILEQHDICVSAGSACSRGKKSHVLRAMGVPERLIDSAIRISLSKDNTEAEIDRFLSIASEKFV